MKTLILPYALSVFFFFLFVSPHHAQQSSACATIGWGSDAIGALPNTSSSLNSGSTNTSYNIRVYIHVLRRPDGTLSQTPARVGTVMNILNTSFNFPGFQFTFYQECETIEIPVSDAQFNSISHCSLFADPLYQYEDGIAIFLSPDTHAPGAAVGFAQNIPSRAMWVGGRKTDDFQDTENAIESPVVAHEMGHCLGLWHTQFGTFEAGPNQTAPNDVCTGNPLGDNVTACCELVDGSNATICGDFVADTDADPSRWIPQANGNCADYGWPGNPGGGPGPSPGCNGSVDLSDPNDPQWLDENGHTYTPPTNNIMSKQADFDCQLIFTPGQGNRMRAILDDPNSAVHPTATEEIIITQTTTWANARNIASDVRILPGVTLNITGTVRNGPEVSYSVEPGGHLNINGGTLTNLCTDKWKGVYVFGSGFSNTARQIPSQQGRVTMSNHATIENSRAGISLQDPDQGSSGWGGYVQATNAHFINNKRSVEFYRFTNHNSIGNVISNASYFRECEFSVTPDYIEDYPGDGFNTHVSMWGVDNVLYRGCTFTNTQTEAQTQADRRFAIRALGAGFRLISYCPAANPEGDCDENEIPCSFNGFTTAVRTSVWPHNPAPFSIQRARFENNHYGVENRGVDMGVITQCDFQVYSDVDHSFYSANLGVPVGIVVNQGHIGTLTENDFTWKEGEPEPGDLSVGILMVETGRDLLTVYNNQFNGIHIANLSNGDNSSTDISAGLQYRCNGNERNDYDIAVPYQQDEITFPSSNSYASAGIGIHQGSSDLSSGNTFSEEAVHIQNEYPGASINYFWKGGPEYEPTNIVGGNVNVNTNPLMNEHECASIIGGSGGKEERLVSEPKRTELDGQATQSKQSYNASRTEYFNLLDGGNTQDLLVQVQNGGGTDDAAQLLDISPFLSSSVLEAVLSNFSFSDDQVFEIWYANPEVLTVKLLNELQNIRPGFSNDQLAELLDRMSDTTERSQMEALMVLHSTRLNKALNVLAYHDYLRAMSPEGELSVHPDETVVRKNTAAVAWYELRRDFAQGSGEFGLIPVTGIPGGNTSNGIATPEELEAWQSYQLWLSYLSTTEGNSLNAYDIADLQGMVASATGRSLLEVQNILSFLEEEIYHTNPLLPDDVGSGEGLINGYVAYGSATNIDFTNLITANPNPAKNQVVFNWNNEESAKGEIAIRVVDQNGRIVLEQNVRAEQSTLIWDCLQVPAGVYFYQLVQANVPPITYRLIINK